MNYHPSHYSPYHTGWYDPNEHYDPRQPAFTPPTLSPMHQQTPSYLSYPSSHFSYQSHPSSSSASPSSSSLSTAESTNAGFIQYYTEDGLPYYYNAITGESIWATPHDWAALYDPRTGALYYYNHITHESQWAVDDIPSTLPPHPHHYHPSLSNHTHAIQSSVLATVAAELPSSPEQEQPSYPFSSSRNPRTIASSNYSYGNRDPLSRSLSTGGHLPPPHRTPFRHYHDAVQNRNDNSTVPLSPSSTILDSILSWSSSMSGSKESSFAALSEIHPSSSFITTDSSVRHEALDSTESVRTASLSTLSRIPSNNDKKERRKRAEKAIRESRKQLHLVAFHPHGINAAKDYPNIEGSNDNVTNLNNRSPKKLYDLSPPTSSASSDNDTTHNHPYGTEPAANEVTEDGKIDVNTARAPGTRNILPPMINIRGNDIESDMDITAAQAAEEFVGLTLAERTVWLRKVLLQFGGSFVAKAQILALFLTANSLSYVKNFMNAILTITKANRIDFGTTNEADSTNRRFATEALEYVRKVTNVAFQQLSPVAELPLTMRSLPALASEANESMIHNGIALSAKRRNKEDGTDNDETGKETKDDEFHVPSSSSVRTKPDEEDDAAYETCGSALPTPGRPDYTANKGTTENPLTVSSTTVPVASSLSDILFSNEAVNSLLRPLQSTVTTLLRSSPPQRPPSSLANTSLPLKHSPVKYSTDNDNTLESAMVSGAEKDTGHKDDSTHEYHEADSLPQYSLPNERNTKEKIYSGSKDPVQYKETFDTEEGWVLRPVEAKDPNSKKVTSGFRSERDPVDQSKQLYSYRNNSTEDGNDLRTDARYSNKDETLVHPDNLVEGNKEKDEASFVVSASSVNDDEENTKGNYGTHTSNVIPTASNPESMVAMLYAHGGTFGFLNNNFPNRTG